MQTVEIIYVPWYLSDRWGTREEGGCSIHKSTDDFYEWKKIYDKKVEGSDCYYVPYKPKTAKIHPDLYAEMIQSEYGLRFDMDQENDYVAKAYIIYEITRI